MLEFLKGCVSDSIYEHAMDCERNLKSFNSLVAMQTYFEKMLKSIYSEQNPHLSDKEIGWLKCSELLNNKKFVLYLNNKYSSFDENDVRSLNNYANENKHSKTTRKATPELIKKYFKIVFYFSAEYYNLNTGNKKPKWHDEEYKTCSEKTDPKNLERQNKILESKQEELRLQKAKNDGLVRQLAELKEQLAQEKNRKINSDKEDEYNLIKKRKEESDKRLAELQQSFEDLQEQFNVIKTQLQRKTDKCQEEIFKLEEEKKKLEKSEDWPICPHCNAKMVPMHKNSDFWGCPNYSSGCEGGARFDNKELRDHYLEIKKKIDMEYRKATVEAHVIENQNKSQVELIAYPSFSKKQIVKNFVFQSLEVPEDVFKHRDILELKHYSRFFLISSIKEAKVPSEIRTIYSMILRLLCRGVVLPIDKYVSEKFKNKFNAEANQTCKPSVLFESNDYSNSWFQYDSEREKYFAQKVFSSLFGPGWCSYVRSQAEIDFLVNTDNQIFKDQRVDFVVDYKENHFVIELDGKEHKQHLSQDKKRDEALRRSGYVVERFTNEEVDNDIEKIIATLKNKYCPETNDEIDVTVSKKYFIACKLFHQIAVSIVKCLEQGYFSNEANLIFSASLPIFNEDELNYIFLSALDYIKELVLAYSKIYDIKLNLKLNNNSLKETYIQFGNGQDLENGIIIRDCSAKDDYACPIEPFDINLLPKNSDDDSLRILLQKIFGFDNFKEGQLQALHRVIEQKDSIILLPTGAGKSLIYQLASYLVPGMIVVISPLRALMEDQIINLDLKFGINNAVAIYYMAKKDEEHEQNQMKMLHNSTSLLYISPERLQIKAFRDNIKIIKQSNNIFTIAIDEAHCVSEWGHDFRAAYLNVGDESRELFKKSNFIPSVIALTGTASNEVLKDVQRVLDITESDAIIEPQTFDRNELNFSIVECDTKNKTNIVANILKNQLPEKFNITFDEFCMCNDSETFSGIVFTPNAASERPGNYDAFNVRNELYHRLPEIRSGCYFSKNPVKYNKSTWDATIKENAMMFKKNELNLLVATKAFGMGIDKSNIRYTIHNGIPASLEQYYQEAGRAARDGKKSECIIVFSKEDSNYNENVLNLSLSFDDFNKMRKSREDREDDLSKVLWFHGGSFKGPEREKEVVKHIIKELNAAGCSKGQESTISLIDGQKLESKADNKTVEIDSNTWEKALVRLKLLGVINSYTRNYSLDTYTIQLCDFDIKSITESYLKYVRKYDIGRVNAERIKIEKIHEETEWRYVESIIYILIDFVYEKIELNRRTCINNMYSTVTKALSFSTPEEQNKFIHEEISNYFQSKDVLNLVYDSKKDGIAEMYSVIDFNPNNAISDEEEIKEASNMLPSIRRLRESKSQLPGLAFLQCAAALKSKRYLDNKNNIKNDILSGIKFAKEYYSTSDDVLFECLAKMLNLVMNTELELFNDIFSEIKKSEIIDIKDCLSSLISSPNVSNENRDYLVLEYAINSFDL